MRKLPINLVNHGLHGSHGYSCFRSSVPSATSVVPSVFSSFLLPQRSRDRWTKSVNHEGTETQRTSLGERTRIYPLCLGAFVVKILNREGTRIDAKDEP